MHCRILPHSSLEYFIKGHHPRLLLHAGTHGDEHEVIDIVTANITKYEDLLPDFIYVPHVSPSAVSQKTRHNHKGLDTNRIFHDATEEDEIHWNQAIMIMGHYDLAVSFHEDPQYKTYYIYDEGEDEGRADLILAHNEHLASTGIELLNGLDDATDPALGSYFANGYKKFHFNQGKYSGDVLNWGMNKGLIKHSLIPETPGLCTLAEKKLIIDSFFEMVILKYFDS